MPIGPCCCATGPWQKARKCSDNTVADIGYTYAEFLTLIATHGTSGSPVHKVFFKYGGVCYYLYEQDASVGTPPATLLTESDATYYNCCSECNTGNGCCDACSPGVPRTIQAVMSGVDFAPVGCYASLFGGADMKVTASGDNNGTYCCELTPGGDGACFWMARLPFPITVELWSSTNGTCTGSLLDSYTMSWLQINTIFSGGTHQMIACIQRDSLILFTPDPSYAAFYGATGDPSDQCNTDVVLSNYYPSQGTFSINDYGLDFYGYVGFSTTFTYVAGLNGSIALFPGDC